MFCVYLLCPQNLSDFALATKNKSNQKISLCARRKRNISLPSVLRLAQALYVITTQIKYEY